MNSINNQPKSLLIGMSHTVAISQAFTAEEKVSFSVIDLNSSPEYYSVKDNKLDIASLADNKYSRIFLSIGGNFHNIFGLAENPIPLGVSSGSIITDRYKNDRFYIPKSMLYDYFLEKLEAPLQHFDTVRSIFLNTPIVCLCSPPPLESPENIIESQGIFREKLKLGVVPYQVRLEFYKIQCEIYRRRCSSLGIEFMDPPKTTVSENGFLIPEYSRKDPTHANASYGRKVLDCLVSENYI